MAEFSEATILIKDGACSSSVSEEGDRFNSREPREVFTCIALPCVKNSMRSEEA
jgi:hypothetical protein